MPRSALTARYRHFALPDAMSMAMSSPVIAPTYAVSPTIAADDSTAPPASNVHCRRSVAGSVVDAMPVSVGVFRNCAHAVWLGAFGVGGWGSPLWVSGPGGG